MKIGVLVVGEGFEEELCKVVMYVVVFKFEFVNLEDVLVDVVEYEC